MGFLSLKAHCSLFCDDGIVHAKYLPSWKCTNVAVTSSESNDNEKAVMHAPHNESNAESPRKAKIWSIAETLSSRAATSAKKDSESASTSAEKSEDGDSESIGFVTSTTISSSASSTTVTTAAAVLSANGMPQPAFLQFNPWQQQMAIAMARVPFPRPDFLTVMAQAGQVRPPPMLFSPLLMGAALSVPPSLTAAPMTPTSQSNGERYRLFTTSISVDPWFPQSYVFLQLPQRLHSSAAYNFFICYVFAKKAALPFSLIVCMFIYLLVWH